MPPSEPAARSYLDHAACAPVRPEVAAQIARDLARATAGRANPAALHASGRRAGAALCEARARLAAALGVDPHEVLFTSGGTEADGLVVVGRVLAARAAGVERPHLVVSPVEHPAVLDSARRAGALGAELTLLDVDAAGRVAPGDAGLAVEPGRTALVSVMTANNEPGHVLDAMTLSGHKLGAPVGTGALVVRREVALTAPTGGGGQERGIRSGTQDVVGARALALAVELAVAEREAQAVRLEALRRRILAGATALPGVHATLPEGASHLPGTAHLWFEDVDAQALLMALDLAGIDASAGSACHAGVSRPSGVLLAMGFAESAARSTLRCSMGRETTAADVERLLSALPGALETARRAARAAGAG